MDKKRSSVLIAATAALSAAWCASAAVDPVSNWNVIAVQATLTAGENGIVQSRTLAIVQVAIHDALNGIDPRYERYAFKADPQAGASTDAAIAAAARDSLVGSISVGALPFVGFGTPVLQAAAVTQVDAAYAAILAGIPDGAGYLPGVWGHRYRAVDRRPRRAGRKYLI